MKTIYIILVLIIGFEAFSQNHSKFVFEFNKKTDEIVFRKNTKKQQISGFKILVGSKLVFFSSNPVKNDTQIKINTSREELKTILQNDNASQPYNFIIYLKDKNKYYSVDHLARKIVCD